ncbi:protein-glutamate O-methyltransferase CheR [Salinisphaera sp.]|uniref:CheR family methyltransferase n=1 Tax=Salinisphaera sp. TaxID=1914330 RepID=UPI002D771B06|nr:protein-glutamate O-methyltransferase CheR [Salinisphaera sp.]HET7315705.1 protein-glutamate O-methyltransferase CheR [Salinisphaera sp.]
MSDPAVTEERALDLFVHTLNVCHGYDFSGYARASLKRRVEQLAADLGVSGIAHLIPRLIYEPSLLGEVIARLSVPVSEMFRDPEVFAALREQVLPVLSSYPRVNIWQAGCALGEEVYSMAILAEEAGLLPRCRFYATDINDKALSHAAEGIFAARRLDDFAANYRSAGGERDFADYYRSRYDLIRMRRTLRDRVVFAHHNLVTDGVFAETHLIMCRNVLIYFSRALKERVLQLFADSLVRGGYLVLGTRETLQFSALAPLFETVSEANRIYRLKRDRVYRHA